MSLAVNFQNNSGIPDNEVYIGFVPGAAPAASTFNVINNQSGSMLLPVNYDFGSNGNWYTLNNLPQGVGITNFSGRIYVAYNQPWSPNGQAQGYEPAQSVTDPNFFLRYDKMEMTFNGNPADVANLTSIDYWSIPLSLFTTKNGNPQEQVHGLLNEATAQELFNTLSALTTPPASYITGPGGPCGTPLPAVVPGLFSQFPGGPTPGTSFARIIGPSSYPPFAPPPGGIPVTPYATFNFYLNNLFVVFGPGTTTNTVPGLGNGIIAHIKGHFNGVGPEVPPTGPQSAQDYELVASIDGNLDITLTGTVGGVSGTTTMVFALDDLLNPSGIYGGNAPFSLNGGIPAPPGNDVYGWVSGDLFSGLNIGAVGSTTPVPDNSIMTGAVDSTVPVTDNNIMVGALPSQEWFNLPTDLFFAGLQPQNRFYNRWAAVLSQYSQAYNFAYSDRFSPVFVSLNPATADTLTVQLEPATVTLPASKPKNPVRPTTVYR
jgi:hypothetical protein